MIYGEKKIVIVHFKVFIGIVNIGFQNSWELLYFVISLPLSFSLSPHEHTVRKGNVSTQQEGCYLQARKQSLTSL